MKREFRWFSIFEYEKEQEYLRRRHSEGWRFVKVTGLCAYQFERCEPEDVVYQLDYNPDSASDKDEYIRMFEDCGWEYLQDYMGYSYFRKPAADMQGDEQIFCDDASRMEMLGRVFRTRMLPLWVIFCACLLPQFINAMAGGHYGIAAFIGIALTLYIVVFAQGALQYFRLKKK